MDDRQTEIRQGEGLNDSRVNQDFVDFLNKWSSPVLMVLAVAALSWAGMQWLENKKIEKVNRAFGDLEAAMAGGSPSPASLRTLATEYAGVRAVPELALLQTTDLYLNAFVRGIEPGAQIDSVTGQPLDENDLLDETQRSAYLEQAGQLAQEVIDLTDGNEGKAILAVQAMVRLAAVKEGKRDFDGAKSMYTKAAERARDAGFVTLAAFADQRAEGVDAIGDVSPLPSQDDLVALPGEEPVDLDLINEILNPVIPGLETSSTDESAPVEELPVAEEAPAEEAPVVDPEPESP